MHAAKAIVASLILLVAATHGLSRRARRDDVSALRAVVQQQAASLQALQTQVQALQQGLAAQTANADSVAQLVQAQRAEEVSQTLTLAEIKAHLNMSSQGDMSLIGVLGTQSTNAVVFSARLTRGGVLKVGPSLGSRVHFAHVDTNLGGGYDNSTGVFTAPVSGTYMFFFSFKLRWDHQTPACYSLMLDGVRLTSVCLHGDTDGRERGSALAATHVQRGQGVAVQHSSGSSWIDTWYETSFVGLLIAKD